NHQPEGAAVHAGDDQRRDPAPVRIGLAAFRLRPAVDHLRPFVPHRAGQAQHPRLQRRAHLRSRPDAVEEVVTWLYPPLLLSIRFIVASRRATISFSLSWSSIFPDI